MGLPNTLEKCGDENHRENRCYELPEEVLAVLECSPNLEPCEEFRYADKYAFAKYLNERRCQECIDFFRQTDKEVRTMKAAVRI